MKLLSLNCQSFKTAKSDTFTLDDNYNLDILCLTETWENDKEKLKFKNWKVYSKARKSDNHGGVAVICKPSQNFITEQITEFEDEELEVVCINIRPEKLQEFLLVVSYIPPGKTEILKKTGRSNKESKC